MKRLTRRWRLVLRVLFVLILSNLARAQQAAVWVEPDRCFLGGEIRASGYVKPGTGSTVVVLTFSPPGTVPPVKREVAAGKDGSFELRFSDTSRAGTWKVEVARKGTSPSAKTSFEVSAGLLGLEVAQSLSEVQEVTRTGFEEFRGVLRPYPTFPGKDEMEKQVEELLQKMDELAAHLASFKDATRNLEEQIKLHSGGIPGAALAALEKATQTARPCA